MFRMTKFMTDQLHTTMAEYRNNDVNCAIDGLLRERHRFLSDHNRPEITMGNIDSTAKDLLIAGECSDHDIYCDKTRVSYFSASIVLYIAYYSNLAT